MEVVCSLQGGGGFLVFTETAVHAPLSSVLMKYCNKDGHPHIGWSSSCLVTGVCCILYPANLCGHWYPYGRCGLSMATPTLCVAQHDMVHPRLVLLPHQAGDSLWQICTKICDSSSHVLNLRRICETGIQQTDFQGGLLSS